MEFAKSKLLPALSRLLLAWVQPGLLLVIFGIAFFFLFHDEGLTLLDGEIAGLGFLALIVLLPGKAAKNTVIWAAGSAFCLLPWLHNLFNSILQGYLMGPCGEWMGHVFSWEILCLSAVGLIVINGWWWKRQRNQREEIPSLLAVAGMILFLLLLSPLTGEWLGNFSLREIYSLPDGAHIPFTGETRNNFLKWKFVEVLASGVVYLNWMLPWVLALIFSLGILLHQSLVKILGVQNREPDPVFPSQSDMPWIMTLIGSGLAWLLAGFIEPPFSEQIQQLGQGYSLTVNGGTALMILFPASLFLVCGHHLNQRLRSSRSIRLFYSSSFVAGEGIVLAGLTLLRFVLPGHNLSGKPDHSSLPLWLFSLLALAVLLIIFRQTFLIREKAKSGSISISLWKFSGSDLLQFGLLLGLVGACAATPLIMLAVVLAYQSTTVIACMIAWGNSTKTPPQAHFIPQKFGILDHLNFWVLAGVDYVMVCLTLGLLIAIVLSGLEFVRFNVYRLYKNKPKKVIPSRSDLLAANE